MRHAVCPQCGATNIGTQTHCLRCQAALPAGEMPRQPKLSQPAPAGYRSKKVAKMCPRCGYANRPGFEFCVQCGTALPVSSAAISTPQKVANACPRCGYVNEAGTSFCTQCGTPLKKTGV